MRRVIHNSYSPYPHANEVVRSETEKTIFTTENHIFNYYPKINFLNAFRNTILTICLVWYVSWIACSSCYGYYIADYDRSKSSSLTLFCMLFLSLIFYYSIALSKIAWWYTYPTIFRFVETPSVDKFELFICMSIYSSYSKSYIFNGSLGISSI